MFALRMLADVIWSTAGAVGAGGKGCPHATRADGTSKGLSLLFLPCGCR